MVKLYQWANDSGAHGMARVEDLERQGFEPVGADGRYGSVLMARAEQESEVRE